MSDNGRSGVVAGKRGRLLGGGWFHRASATLLDQRYPECRPLPWTPEDDRRATFGEPPVCRALVRYREPSLREIIATERLAEVWQAFMEIESQRPSLMEHPVMWRALEQAVMPVASPDNPLSAFAHTVTQAALRGWND